MLMRRHFFLCAMQDVIMNMNNLTYFAEINNTKKNLHHIQIFPEAHCVCPRIIPIGYWRKCLMEFFVNSLNRSSFFVAIVIRICIWEFDKYQPPKRQDKGICLFHMTNTLYYNLAIGLYF